MSETVGTTFILLGLLLNVVGMSLATWISGYIDIPEAYEPQRRRWGRYGLVVTIYGFILQAAGLVSQHYGLSTGLLVLFFLFTAEGVLFYTLRIVTIDEWVRRTLHRRRDV